MFKSQWSQFFPPKPSFSEADIPSQAGKVFIVTGGYSGIGLELVKFLYQKNARVYIAGRSEEKASKAIEETKASSSADVPSTASLEFLHLDLADLSTIKTSVEAFKSKETKLHVLWNNAGVSQPPLGSLSKQGMDLQLATNCLGPFLFMQLLLPLLEYTASASSSSPPGSVRVIWTASQMIELSAPKGGIIMSEIHEPTKDVTRNYTNTKTGNFLLSAELARRQQIEKERPVVSVSLNPGAASTNLFRHTPMLSYLAWPLFHEVKLAATTQLYAGLSEDITAEKNGCYVMPWGRIAEHMREDLVEAGKPKEGGGTGRAQEFWEFCVDKTRSYL